MILRETPRAVANSQRIIAMNALPPLVESEELSLVREERGPMRSLVRVV